MPPWLAPTIWSTVELGILASYLIPSLALGVVFRRPVIKANDWIIEKLESTKLISLRGFAKPRNGSTLQTALSGNLTFNFKGATRRSAPFHFTSPCSLRVVFADVAETSRLFKLVL